jgi:hypothetical protein
LNELRFESSNRPDNGLGGDRLPTRASVEEPPGCGLEATWLVNARCVDVHRSMESHKSGSGEGEQHGCGRVAAIMLRTVSEAPRQQRTDRGVLAGWAAVVSMRRVEGSLSGLAPQRYAFGMPARRGMQCAEVVPPTIWNDGHGRREANRSPKPTRDVLEGA